MKKHILNIVTVSLLAGALLLNACKDKDVSPAVAQITPARAASNEVLTVKGAGLGNVTSITFEKGNVAANFTPTFNTDGAILFRVPSDALPGEQNIVFRNSSGTEFKASFFVLGYAAVTSVSDYNFTKDGEITLTGKNLDDVTKVTFAKDTLTQITVVSKTATSLTLKFPATSLSESALRITNGSGASVTGQSFVAMDNALELFTDDYGSGYQDGSWGASGISTTEFKSGTASKFMTYAKGNWSQDGFGWTETPNAGYKNLAFWIKGGSQDYNLYIWSSAQPGTFNTFDDFKKIVVPANVWTYFKIPVTTLKIWGENNTTAWNQIGWRIQGPDAQDETFYLDDVIFIK